jgi:ubiquitin carboxyl-terminal hydrolase 8
MDLTKYHKKGFTGLENLGNTCFLNSCMQVLNHTYELNDFLDSKKYDAHLKRDTTDSKIMIEWNDLRQVMWSGNGVVTPNRFVNNVHQIAEIKQRDLFTGYAQNDMPEFLLFFLDCMHNSISRGINVKISGNTENETDQMAIQCYNMLKTTYSKEYSEIMDMFYGIFNSEIISMNTGDARLSIKPESYFMLDLPVIDGQYIATNLHGCFEFFTKPEILDGDNAWFNEKTGEKENVKKQFSFWNFPKILVITLKRFTPGMQKIGSLIDFPINDLDLSRYVRGYNPNSYKYDLYGVCNHVGGTMGGHYTAFVRNSENQWLHCNDRHVEVVDNPQHVVTPMAYCLFYRKKNNLL